MAIHHVEVPAVSPELALVDPDLRAYALAALPPVEPFAFLRLGDSTPAPRAEAPRLAAALAYLAVALLRTCAFDACVFATVAVIVFLVNVFA